MKKIFFIAASLFAASLLGVSCDNSDSDSTTQAAAPEIVSISPASSPAGESVTIAGKNFSADAASNVVTFGSAAATVVQASATELVVTVPEIEAGQVDVAVKVGDKSSAAVKFTVEAALSITKCNASVVTAGDIVTVEGAGFEGATIKIGETVITTTLAYDDFFRFAMPSLAKGEHQITVSKNGKTAQSEKFVYYSLPQYEVSKWAGNPSSTEAENAVAGGSIDGTELHFYFPDGLCWDADGKLCISNATKHSAIHYVDMNSKYVTCVATGTRLHLIEPLGFRLNEKEIKRAGMDYWDDLEVIRYVNYEEFIEKNPGAKIYYATTKAKHTYTEVNYESDCYIMFGKESAGIPEEILE